MSGLHPAGWKVLNNPSARKSPLMTHANAPLTPAVCGWCCATSTMACPKPMWPSSSVCPARSWRPGWPATVLKETQNYVIVPVDPRVSRTRSLPRSLSASSLCGETESGRPGGSTTTCREWDTSCICAPWAGGCTDSGSPGYAISPRMGRTCAGHSSASVPAGPGIWSTRM